MAFSVNFKREKMRENEKPLGFISDETRKTNVVQRTKENIREATSQTLTSGPAINLAKRKRFSRVCVSTKPCRGRFVEVATEHEIK
jgi:hypothetical protein